MAAFVDQTGVGFPVVRDDGSLFHSVAFPDSLSPYPRQVLVGADGRIRYVASEHRASELDEVIEAAIRGL